MYFLSRHIIVPTRIKPVAASIQSLNLLKKITAFHFDNWESERVLLASNTMFQHSLACLLFIQYPSFIQFPSIGNYWVSKNVLLVKRFVAPDMSCRVDEPSEVEGHGVPPDRSHVPRSPRVLSPEVHGHPRWQQKTKERHHDQICPGKLKNEKNNFFSKALLN